MSDEAWFHQNNAIAANNRALIANNDAFNARMRAHDAEMNASHKEHQLRAAEAANRDMEDELEQHRRQSERINTEVSRAAFVTEAITAIPYLRSEIISRYDFRNEVRNMAEQWLSGVPLGEAQSDLLIRAIDCTDGKSQSWFAFALAASLAREAGDIATAEKWMEVASAGSPILAAAWAFMDTVRTDATEVTGKRFKVLADTLNRNSDVHHEVWRILTEAADGTFGPAVKQEVVHIVQRLHDQLSSDTAAESRRKEIAQEITQPTKNPDWLTGLEKHAPPAVKRFAETVANTWANLASVENAFNRHDAPAKESIDPVAFATKRMLEMAKIQDHDETKHRARLGMYLAAEDSEGNKKVAEEARVKSIKASRGVSYGASAVMIGLCKFTELRSVILQICRGWIASYVATFPSPEKFKDVPPLHPGGQSTRDKLFAQAQLNARAQMPAEDLAKIRKAKVDGALRNWRIKIAMSALKGAAFGLVFHLITLLFIQEHSNYSLSQDPLALWNLLTSNFWIIYPMLFAYFFGLRKKRALGPVKTAEIVDTYMPTIAPLDDNTLQEASLCDKSYEAMRKAIADMDGQRQRIAALLRV